MTKIEERAQALSKELRELVIWEINEDDKIVARLKAEGKVLGLDGYPEEFAPIRRERERRLAEIFERYKDLPPDTKLKLW